MFSLTPKEIVSALSLFVVGQDDAKKAVANALRNRWRRKMVADDIRDEIVPHNILMVGPTGVGKTEIARRIAKMTDSPFIKVEATKFTEIGYVGRDVDSIIRDLTDIAFNKIKESMRQTVQAKAHAETEKRILQALVGQDASDDTKERFLRKLRGHELDENEIEIEVLETAQSPMQTMDIPGGQLGMINMTEMFGKAFGGKRTKTIRAKVADAFAQIITEESDKLIDEEQVTRKAIQSVEQDGIVFIDEIDKIASRASGSSGSRAEVSREGVQRDLLPLIEGTVVTTKYGTVRTNHILFIASGAFHLAKPSDLLPELQGRLPVRVELKPLTEGDLVRILTEPNHNLPNQYKAMLAVEKVDLEFTEDGIRRIAKLATEMNERIENIGARRLHTMMEKLLEAISFTAPDLPNTKVLINESYVINHLDALINSNMDMSKFIL